MFLCVHVLVFVICSVSSRAEVVLDSDGGFTNLAVGIHPDVPESKIRTVLSDLELLFKNASRVLHTATRGQTYFKEVVFAVPKKYRTALAGRPLTSESGYFKRPEVILTSGDALSEPYALQHRGCGKQGLRIHVPEAFLYTTHSNKDKSLVREWAKYRYGVFEESGWVGDDLYPACYRIPGSDTIKVADCTNEKAIYHNRKTSGNLPLPCDRVPIAGKNNHIISSMMNKIDFPEVSQFCDDDKFPHNKNTPSKQNSLCRKQSTWKVISEHNDFQIKGKKKARVDVVDTKFKYVIEPEFRLIIAVDTSNEMNKYDRLNMVQNAFSYFTLFSLPENSVVGLKDLGKPEKKTTLLTVKAPADAEILIDAFPETGGGADLCMQCGIEEALQELKGTSDAPHGQVLVISATDLDKDASSLENKLRKSDVSLHVMYFNKRLKEPPLLQKLSAATGGQFHYIPDTEGTLNVLYEAFRSIYESFSWMNRNHVLVNQRAYSHSSCSSCNLTFLTDQSMENFQVLLTGPRFFDGPPVVKDRTVLSNGNQEFAPGHSSYSYKRKIPAYVFTIKNPKPGPWTLTFERKAGFINSLVVIVRSSSTKHNSIARMSAWMNYEVNPKRQPLTQPPIAFYSEVMAKHSPVANVSVSAIVYNPQSDEETTLRMFDVGDGDPDITRNDGIFSKYFTESTKSGYYLVTMVAESKYPEDRVDNSTQGEVNSPAMAFHMAPFQRIVTLGSFFLPPEGTAVQFPPRRISDLRVDTVVIADRSPGVAYRLKWTSPGDNYDSGMVSDYQLRLFSDPTDAETKFDEGYIQKLDDFSIHGQMLTRSTLSGSPQSAIVELRNLSTGSYYIAMRTINAQNKFSDISNVVEVWYDKPTTPTNRPLTDQDGSTISIITSTESDQPLSLASGLGLALGLTFGILLILIIIGCVLCLYFRRRKSKSSEVPKDQDTGRRDLKSESMDVLYQSTNPLEVSVISPVNSWPANSLISHYESLKKDKTSEISEDSAVPKDASDTVSLASSYINRTDHNYDAVYFNSQKREDVLSYPYNPGFNPVYTSSLRKLDDDRKAGNGYSPSYSTLNASMLDGRGSMNPVFVSSLPRPRALERVLGEYSPSNTSCSSYTLDGHGNLRLGTDV